MCCLVKYHYNDIILLEKEIDSKEALNGKKDNLSRLSKHN